MELMGNAIFNLLAMLVTLGILVTIHEFGHFRIARLCGVKVEKFSIGFGKSILSWRGKPEVGDAPGDATEYVIGILPLGGFVKMKFASEYPDFLFGTVDSYLQEQVK